MERKGIINNQFKLAACFFLLSVVLRGVSVEACQQEHQDCSSLACCDGLECVEVSPGVFECEEECCEEHPDHPCELHVREGCHDAGIVCECDDNEHPPYTGKTKTYTKNLGDTCDKSTDICALRAVCQDDSTGTDTDKCICNGPCQDDCDCCVHDVCSTNGQCVCRKGEDDPCDPNACIPGECCERECVAVAVGDYRCKTV